MNKKLLEVLKDKSGFTALQNIMIFSIILILVVVGSYAFFGYMSSSYQVKAENTAKKAFAAAQEYMDTLVRQGGLEDFNETAVKFGGVIAAEEQIQILKSAYSGADFESFIEEFKEGYKDVPIRYLLLESADTAKSHRSDNPIISMMEYKVLDANILKHTFLVEYNSKTGKILSVFYSEKTDSFTYDGKTDSKSNVILRDNKSLKSKWQGYCSVSVEDL